TGTLTRINTDNGLPLTVNLTSSDSTRATVPATVVIPAGQASATFPIAAVNDPAINGPANVTISGSAPLPVGFAFNSGFGTSGTINNNFQTETVAVQPDGKVLSVGYANLGNNTFDLRMSRYGADGKPD